MRCQSSSQNLRNCGRIKKKYNSSPQESGQWSSIVIHRFVLAIIVRRSSVSVINNVIQNLTNVKQDCNIGRGVSTWEKKKGVEQSQTSFSPPRNVSSTQVQYSRNSAVVTTLYETEHTTRPRTSSSRLVRCIFTSGILILISHDVIRCNLIIRDEIGHGRYFPEDHRGGPLQQGSIQ